jgi:hypothetical protein
MALPNEWGSGGGGYDYSGNAGGNGGGLVKITTATLSLAGSILADGAGTTYYNAGGSGGGILINAGTLSGSGTIYARGGAASYSANYSGSGGGGRIAIYYDSMTLPAANILASGGKTYDGSNSSHNGGAGTIYLKDNAKAKPDVIINNAGILSSTTTAVPGGDYLSVTAKGGAIINVTGTFTTEAPMTLTDSTMTIAGGVTFPGDLVVTNSTLNVSGTVAVLGKLTMNKSSLTLKDNLTVNEGISLASQSVLSHYGATTTAVWKLEVTSPNISVDATSKIDVSGKGYLAGWQNGNNVVAGRTFGNTNSGGSGLYNGASYGGLGGVSGSGGSVNAAYGSLVLPNEWGSGGGGYDYSGNAGGNGGGLVKITTASLSLAGSILADGAGTTYYNGGGSGGGILINAGTLSGSGTIYARGGAASYSANYAGSGGGGRIAIYYDSMTLPTANVLASGGKTYDGSNSSRNGGAGTVYLKDNARSKADVIVNNGGINTTRVTSIPSGDYRIFDVIGGALYSATGTITNENVITLKDAQFTFSGNYSVPRDLTLLNATVTVTGGVTVPGKLLMTNSSLSLRNDLNVTGTITAQTGSVLTHEGATSSNAWKLDIQSGAITVDATSKIDASGKGYLGGWQGDNGFAVGKTIGNVTDVGSPAFNGGSYGGLGGYLSNESIGSAYGGFLDPHDLGSGGGGFTTAGFAGGNGGGFIKIKAPSLTLNGSILADASDSAFGGGSGGAIRLDVGAISGSGSIRARGGAGGIYGDEGNGGGGGRVAIYYTSNTLPTANITASGGAGFDGATASRNGGAGTVYLKLASRTYGDLTIDNRGLITADNSTPVTQAGVGVISILTADSLTQSGVSWIPSALKGYWINPNTTQGSFFSIKDNTADTIFINAADGNLNSVAVVGNSFSGVSALNSLSVLGKARVYTTEQFNVVGDASIDDASVAAGNLYAGRTLLTNGGVLSTLQAP